MPVGLPHRVGLLMVKILHDLVYTILSEILGFWYKVMQDFYHQQDLPTPKANLATLKGHRGLRAIGLSLKMIPGLVLVPGNLQYTAVSGHPYDPMAPYHWHLSD